MSVANVASVAGVARISEGRHVLIIRRRKLKKDGIWE